VMIRVISNQRHNGIVKTHTTDCGANKNEGKIRATIEIVISFRILPFYFNSIMNKKIKILMGCFIK